MRGKAWLVGGLLSFIAGVAQAGPNESPADFAVNPVNPDFWVLRYEYSRGGFLVSEDAGASWRLVCNSAVQAMSWPNDDDKYLSGTFDLAVGSDGTILSGSGDYDGLLAGHASGCSWGTVPTFAATWVPHLAIDPVTPTRVLAATTGPVGIDHGLYAYDALTGTWTALGNPERIGIASLALAPLGSGRRIYQTIVRDYLDETVPIFVVRYSDDGGVSWTEHAYPETFRYGDLQVVAVDPSDPDRIAVALTFGRGSGQKDRVWVNAQAGDPTAYVELSPITRLGGAVFDDSGVLFVGDSAGELLRLGPSDSEAAPVGSMLSPRCLHSDGDGVLRICRADSFGEVDPATGDYTPILESNALDENIAIQECSAQGWDMVATCEEQLNVDGWCRFNHWPYSHLCEAYDYPGLKVLGVTTGGAMGDGGVSLGGDDAGAGGTTGGAVDAGGDVAATGGTMSTGALSSPESSTRSGCSCSAVGRGAGQDASWIAGGLATLWMRRRRRKRRHAR